MKIGVDAQLAIGTATGIGEYVRGLIGGLRAHGLEVAALEARSLDPWRFDRRVLWDQVLLPLRSATSGCDLLHCASGTMPLISAGPVVTTVHDVAWLKVQAHARPYAKWYFGRFSLARYAHARQIVVDSEFSRSELLQFLHVPHTRVRVVYPGVAEDYCAIVRSPDEQPFLLCVGTVEKRKNLEVVIRALASVEKQPRLVVVGPNTPYQDQCMDLARALGVAAQIEWRGYVGRDVLLDLFARAAVVVMPSKYEGFGYAAAQALCAGVPLVVSTSSSLPEVVEGEAPAIDPDDASGWSLALNAILHDPARAQARATAVRHGAIARFAWRASIARMCEVYEAALQT
ncbi:MAG: glycosyltransferase family 4 protein [Candidatus Eremiobacteraeota bacterium]|nr:glycosyltransferase family 4 protein [Candidatus Eremiobacteraeota bacterium]